MPTPYNYIVTASTSLIQIDAGNLYSANSTPIVLLSTLTSPGIMVTIRDVGGNASATYPIFISTTTGSTWVTTPPDNEYNLSSPSQFSKTYVIAQPYGYATVTARNSTVWGLINTFGFPSSAAVFNIGAINTSQMYLSSLNANYEANFSTSLTSTLSATNVFIRQNVSAGQSTIFNNTYVRNLLQIQSTLRTESLADLGSTVQVTGRTILSNVLTSVSTISTGHDLFAQNSFFVSSISTGGNVSIGGVLAVGGAMSLDSLSTLKNISIGQTLMVGGTISSLGSFSTGSDVAALNAALVGSLSTGSNLSTGGSVWIGTTLSVATTAAVAGVFTPGSIQTIGTISTGSNVAALNVYAISSISIGRNLSIGGDIFIGGAIQAAGSGFESLSTLNNLSVGSNLWVGKAISTNLLWASTLRTGYASADDPGWNTVLNARNSYGLLIQNSNPTGGYVDEARIRLSNTTVSGKFTDFVQVGVNGAMHPSALQGDAVFFTNAASQRIFLCAGNGNANFVASNTNNGINNVAPAYALDVTGDVNCSGNYRGNGSLLTGVNGAQTFTNQGTFTITSNNNSFAGLQIQVSTTSASFGASGNLIGSVQYGVRNPSGLYNLGGIGMYAAGPITNTSAPGYISFTTTSNNSTNPVERLRINSNGDIHINNYNGASNYMLSITPSTVMKALGIGSINGFTLAQYDSTMVTDGAGPIGMQCEANALFAGDMHLRSYYGVSVDLQDQPSAAGQNGQSRFGSQNYFTINSRPTQTALSYSTVFAVRASDGWTSIGRINQGPSYALDVGGDIRCSGSFRGDGSQLTGISANPNSITGEVTITSTNSVQPKLILQVSTNAFTNIVAGCNIGALNWQTRTNPTTSNLAGVIQLNAGGTWGPSSCPSYMWFATCANGTNAFSERMRIDSNGYVGIGTTTPAYSLDVIGDIQASGSLRVPLGTGGNIAANGIQGDRGFFSKGTVSGGGTMIIPANSICNVSPTYGYDGHTHGAIYWVRVIGNPSPAYAMGFVFANAGPTGTINSGTTTSGFTFTGSVSNIPISFGTPPVLVAYSNSPTNWYWGMSNPNASSNIINYNITYLY